MAYIHNPEVDHISRKFFRSATILPVALAVRGLDLKAEKPFIAQQLADLTGFSAVSSVRDLRHLDEQGLVRSLDPDPRNIHLKPYAWQRHEHWRGYTIWPKILDINVKDLFDISWADIPYEKRATQEFRRRDIDAMSQHPSMQPHSPNQPPRPLRVVSSD